MAKATKEPALFPDSSEAVARPNKAITLAATPSAQTVAGSTAAPPGRRPPTGAKAKQVAKVEQLPTPNLLAALVAAAADPTCMPEKMHALLDARERIMLEEAKVGYRRAYRAVKAELPIIDKDGKIDEGTTRSGRQGKKTKYATFENINVVVAPILAKHGLDLSLQSEPKPGGEGILMRATLSYIAQTRYGEIVYSESCVVPMPPDPTGSKNAAQAVSSSLSYGKRNAVILVLNIVSKAPQDRDLDGQDPASIKEPVVEKISTEQATALRKKIEEVGLMPEKFCGKYKIDGVGDLSASLFKEAIASCDDYGRRTRAPKGDQ